MPACQDCGQETPREDMFGPPNDLRCRTCANKRRSRMAPPRLRRAAEYPPAWTTSLIVMAVVVYFGQHSPTGAALLQLLAARPERIWDGEVWRLVTTVLPHVGVVHLLFNCMMLAQVGPAIETNIGSWRFLGLSLLSALGAHAFSFLIDPVSAVGLSGLLYGLCGYLYALRNHRDFAARVVTERFTKTIFGWLILCFALTYLGSMRVANWAHLGGLIVGWLVGRAELTKRPQFGIAGLVVLVTAMVALTQWMPWIPHFRVYRELSRRNIRFEQLQLQPPPALDSDLAPAPTIREGDDS